MAPLRTCKTGCSREKTEGKSDSWTSSHGEHGTIDSPDFVTGEELVEFAIPGEGNATEKGHGLNGGGVDRPRCFDGVLVYICSFLSNIIISKLFAIEVLQTHQFVVVLQFK